ncbi:MAG: DNA mismatch endonuclease Vsr [Pseudomonadota bacterium]
MVDIVDKATRSRMMAGIGGKNTRPEMAVRQHLFAAGFRYRLHRRDLPGRPDIVLPKYKTVIFVHGCFWHRHTGCRFAAVPATNAQFWREKLDGNVERDRRSARALRAAGWRVLRVWECRTSAKDLERLVADLAKP